MYKCIAFGLLLAISAHLHANADHADKLDQVESEINALNASVKLDKASQSELFAKLKQQTKAISSVNNGLLKLDKKIRQQQAKLTQLKQQQQQSLADQQQQVSALSKQIRAAFDNSRPNVIKLFLSQQQPAQLSRASTYFSYFNTARKQQLAEIKSSLGQLTSEQKALFAAQKQQRILYQQKMQQKTQLEKQQQKRQSILTALNKKIANQDSQLNLLKQQQQQLQSLLQSLDQKRSTQTPTKQTAHFSVKSDKLLWPVKGKVLARFGTNRKLGKLKWQGIMIATPAGRPVKASGAGRVIFSDWLRGFGLLMIIDHGDQYMTLYGNNQTLLKQVGDMVVSGEHIAYSGDKGIRQYAGLYFEVRHKGQPKNPLKWLGKS